MIPLNYHHLYYFWVVARAGSITAARERLLLAQPTLSLQLSQLEKSCGGQLLERGRHGVTLTPLGAQVFEHCERIFTEGEALAAVLKTGPDAPTVRVGVEGTVPRDVVLALMDRAREQAPEVRLRLFSGAAGLSGRLRRRLLDILLLSRDPSADLGPGFRVRQAGELQVAFLGRRDLLKRGEPLREALARLPLILRPPGHPVREQTDAFLARLGITPRVEAELEDVELLRQLLLAGRGVAPLQVLAAREDLERGRLVRLHDKPLGVVDRVWMAAPSTASGAAPARSLVQSLFDRFGLKG